MGILKKLYNWVLSWANSPYGTWALFWLAFFESSFFPIPPDILLIALSVSIPYKSFFYAFICSLGSILGGIFGYFLGLMFMDVVGFPILELYGILDKYQYVQELYNKYDALAIGIAGFSPLPYKLFTISAGACKVNFIIFLLASALSRSARFFLVGTLIYLGGASIKIFIDKYFNLLSFIFVILLISGFIVFKFIFP
jgi:membrane protein YqaA with SNARE-associated domain